MAGSRYSGVRAPHWFTALRLEKSGLVYLTFAGFGRLDAEWISAKKDWQNAKRSAKEQTRRKRPVEGLGLGESSLEDITFSSVQESDGEESHQHAPAPAPAPTSSDDEPSRDSCSYQPEMDEMRCILYAHGGMYLSLPFLVVLNRPTPRGLLFR